MFQITNVQIQVFVNVEHRLATQIDTITRLLDDSSHYSTHDKK